MEYSTKTVSHIFNIEPQGIGALVRHGIVTPVIKTKQLTCFSDEQLKCIGLYKILRKKGLPIKNIRFVITQLKEKDFHNKPVSSKVKLITDGKKFVKLTEDRNEIEEILDKGIYTSIPIGKVSQEVDSDIEDYFKDLRNSPSFEKFTWEGKEYILKTPIRCKVRYEDGYWFYNNEEYRLSAYGKTREDALLTLNEQFAYMCEVYPDKKDEELTKGARKLRDLLKENLQEIKYINGRL